MDYELFLGIVRTRKRRKCRSFAGCQCRSARVIFVDFERFLAEKLWTLPCVLFQKIHEDKESVQESSHHWLGLGISCGSNLIACH